MEMPNTWESFADHFGCAFTHCSGYQGPLPLVCLHRGGTLSGPTELDAIAFGSGWGKFPSRLVRLGLQEAGPCSSFASLIEHATMPPVALPEGTSYFKSLGTSGDISSVVYRTRRNSWATTILRAHGNVRATRSVDAVELLDVSSVALEGDNVWCISGVNDARANLQCGTAGNLFDSNALWHYTININGTDVVSRNSDEAVVLGGGSGITLYDRRAPKATLCGEASGYVTSGTVAGTHFITCVSRRGSQGTHCLDVFDVRRNASPLVSCSDMGLFARCRGTPLGRYVLLTTTEEVAVFDVRSLAFMGSFCSPDGGLLDSVIVEEKDDSQRSIEVCCSASNSMLYRWTLSL